MSLPDPISQLAFDIINKTAMAQKYQKLYHRGILSWDEVAEEFEAHGLGDPVEYIGTREDDAKAREVLP